VDPELDGSLVSQTTGVTLRLEGQLVRAVETATGQPFLRTPETDAALEATKELAARQREALAEAKRIAAREREARVALEDEVARLRRELERRSSS
jgi:hypothetical protein